jgi:hypothetical protein
MALRHWLLSLWWPSSARALPRLLVCSRSTCPRISYVAAREVGILVCTEPGQPIGSSLSIPPLTIRAPLAVAFLLQPVLLLQLLVRPLLVRGIWSRRRASATTMSTSLCAMGRGVDGSVHLLQFTLVSYQLM